jgi:hypothetical protein
VRLTKEQTLTLIDAGWVWVRSVERFCRKCGGWISRDEAGWASPKDAYYHLHCMLKSAQVNNLLKKRKSPE